MKAKILSIILLAIVGLTLTSCENFRDNNGDLGGMWQLTQWRTRGESGQIDKLVADNIYEGSQAPNPRKIYYCIHRDVIQFEDATKDQRYYFFAGFEYKGNQLLIKKNIVDQKDNECSYADLQDFGVPSDGKFEIVRLSSDELILKYEGNELQFRKY